MTFITTTIQLGDSLQSIARVPANVMAQLNLTNILDRGAAVLLNRTRTRYLAKVDPDGVPWLPSKAGMRRASRGQPGTLFDTGRLFRSIQLHTVSETERAISTDVSYAVKHQKGEGVQMRQFLGWNKEDQRVFNRVVDKLVKEAVDQMNSGAA